MNAKSCVSHLTAVPLHLKYFQRQENGHSAIHHRQHLKIARNMNRGLVVVLFLSSFRAVISANECVNNTASQRVERGITGGKRYLVFPQGSNVQLVYCLTLGTYAKPKGFFTMGITAGLAYELPHENTVPYRKPAEVYHRRSRRDLYKKLELMLNTRGKDGKACVLKALCLSGQRNRTQVGSGSFMEELLHSVFTLKGGAYENDPKTHYERASENKENCQAKYSSCTELF